MEQFLVKAPLATALMFTGHDFIHELGLYDFRNRFYSPELGRFLQTDPLGSMRRL